MKVFPSAIAKLIEADQKKLIRLLDWEITDNHFDPEKDILRTGTGVFKAKLRTKRLVVTS